MPQQPFQNRTQKRVAVAAIKRGELTVSEVADLLQVSKSTVSRWCSFDVDLARRKRVVKLWNKLIGKDPRVSKSEMKAMAGYAEGVAERYEDALTEGAE